VLFLIWALLYIFDRKSRLASRNKALILLAALCVVVFLPGMFDQDEPKYPKHLQEDIEYMCESYQLECTEPRWRLDPHEKVVKAFCCPEKEE